MTITTRTQGYGLTAVAATLYVGLGIAFADGSFTGPLLVADAWAESSAVSWLLLAAIVLGGMFQARQLPAGGDIRTGWPGRGWSGRGGQFAVLWLPVRFFVGREWLASGEQKLRDPGWMSGGSSLQGYWENAVAIPEGSARPAITYDWFRTFLQFMLDREWYGWFARLVAIGEFLVGAGLILGALVGLAAFGGSLMNFNFMLAGSSSANPVLFALGIVLILGWKGAGRLGIDGVLLRRVNQEPAARPTVDRTGGPYHRGSTIPPGRRAPQP